MRLKYTLNRVKVHNLLGHVKIGGSVTYRSLGTKAFKEHPSQQASQ